MIQLSTDSSQVCRTTWISYSQNIQQWTPMFKITLHLLHHYIYSWTGPETVILLDNNVNTVIRSSLRTCRSLINASGFVQLNILFLWKLNILSDWSVLFCFVFWLWLRPAHVWLDYLWLFNMMRSAVLNDSLNLYSLCDTSIHLKH